MNDSHTQNIEAPDRPATEIEGDVQACGEKFKASRKDAAYCSAACRQRAHRQRSAEAFGWRRLGDVTAGLIRDLRRRRNEVGADRQPPIPLHAVNHDDVPPSPKAA